MIKVITLEGRRFYRHSWGMTMTSRNSYDPELWVVVEDKGATCIVAQLVKGIPETFGRAEWSREVTEKAIKSFPAYRIIGDYEITL